MAGRMDRRIRLERLLDGTPSESGEPVNTWPVLAQVWAEKQPLRGLETFQSDQVAAFIIVRWRIRYRTDIHPESVRLVEVDTGRVYDIQAVEEIGRKEGLQILTQARAEAAA